MKKGLAIDQNERRIGNWSKWKKDNSSFWFHR